MIKYTKIEAVERGDLSSLTQVELDEIVDALLLEETTKSVLEGCEVCAGLPSEDDAYEPVWILTGYEDRLLYGNKADRAQVLKKIQEELREHAQRQMRSAEYGRDEWHKVVKMLKKED